MSKYSEFFLASTSNIVQIELLEISHPNFTKPYRIVRNVVAGVTVTDENMQELTFDYLPIRLQPNGSRNDLDQSITITIGDLGELIPKELDRIRSANGFSIKPTIRYWAYRSDDLSSPLFGPVPFKMDSIAFTKEGCSFQAKAQSLNLNRTGELYTFDRFPMLRGFL